MRVHLFSVCVSTDSRKVRNMLAYPKLSVLLVDNKLEMARNIVLDIRYSNY